MAPSDTYRPRQAGLRNVSSAETTGRTDAPSAQRRNDGQLSAAASTFNQELMPVNSESWVEVTSQPSSSSSLSSIGDEIVTTGLRVGGISYPPRRRRTHQQHAMPASFIVGHPATQGGTTSSQEEYDETESEEDRVMTSSTEAVHPSASLPRHQTAMRASAVVDIDSESDDDENATALGRPSNSPVFRPQPNAFSHPPSHLAHRHSTGSAAYNHPSHSRPPMPNRPHARSHRGQSYMSPPNEADNDAALRASLTTLLSCAAAARGLPKNEERRTAPGAGAGVVPSSQPMELRLVPESELMATNSPPAPPTATPASGARAKTARTASNSSAPSAPSSSSGREHQQQQQQRDSKRGLPSTTQGRPARAAKKKRTSTTLLDGDSATDAAPFFSVSPTLLTWVVSAGVVVLVSVVGFGAGYVIGREVGRQEGGGSSVAAAASSSLVGSGGAAANASSAGAAGCGGELVRAGAGGTLRRFRWGGVGKSVAA
ncbi:hypothetical protein CHGG_00834 [Chaetomium globosum CBS 148.51]|uniref:Uncharacterized protein n=1 Tax=Chaetomium globosum (strain ATCC 6205 / CBS 148.51 / DSM 1962 / NBRC 6347 / NRRL 1970) TaxID=306901 RepID=Q2HG20_CHAGB|nr:uncharacterized protein CHGG_00834 [Chaetomium globosum CBS 148.51]EAQ92599.1 hypothetical protein CHGG_00834 [Chaetomium globosum CBS 148.51]